MAYLIYNNVALGIGGLLSQVTWDRTSEYDGPTFLGIRHRIRVRGQYNPNDTSYLPVLQAGTAATLAPFPLALTTAQIQLPPNPPPPPPPPLPNVQPDPPLPLFTPGLPPVITDITVRELLSRPQQQLYYIVGNVIILASPLLVPAGTPPNVVDDDNGPVPIVHSVDTNTGEQKTWWVDFEISTLINACGIASPPPDIINSHRWVMSHTIDSEGLCVRQIDGHVFFRTSRLQVFPPEVVFSGFTGLTNGTPNSPVIQMDQLRGWLFHPPFPNSRREVVKVEPNEDGDEYRYTIRDVELPINLYNKGATRVQVTHSCDIDYEGVGAPAKRLLDTDWTHLNLGNVTDILTVVGGLVDAAPKPAAPVPWWQKFLYTGTFGVAGALYSGLIPAGSLAMVNPNNVPTVIITVNVKIWGTRNTTRYALQNLASQIAMSRLNLSLQSLGNNSTFSTSLVNVAKIMAGKRVSILHQVEGKYVEIMMQIRSQVLGVGVVSLLSQQVQVNGPGSPLILTMPAAHLAFPFQQLGPPNFAGNPLGTPFVPHPTSDETPTEPLPSFVGPPAPQTLNTMNIGPQFGVGLENDGGSRGSYLGLAIPQALLAPCQQSPEPTDPPMIQLPKVMPTSGNAPPPPPPSPPFVTTVVPWTPP